jgi:hypothetical protein
MPEKTFQQRLAACQRDGNLTVSDLARWFDRSRPTVRGWAELGTLPGGGPLDIEHAHSLLKLLEVLIKRKSGFPIPRLSPAKRIEHLMHIRKKALP